MAWVGAVEAGEAAGSELLPDGWDTGVMQPSRSMPMTIKASVATKLHCRWETASFDLPRRATISRRPWRGPVNDGRDLHHRDDHPRDGHCSHGAGVPVRGAAWRRGRGELRVAGRDGAWARQALGHEPAGGPWRAVLAERPGCRCGPSRPAPVPVSPGVHAMADGRQVQAHAPRAVAHLAADASWPQVDAALRGHGWEQQPVRGGQRGVL